MGNFRITKLLDGKSSGDLDLYLRRNLRLWASQQFEPPDCFLRIINRLSFSCTDRISFRIYL